MKKSKPKSDGVPESKLPREVMEKPEKLAEGEQNEFNGEWFCGANRR